MISVGGLDSSVITMRYHACKQAEFARQKSNEKNLVNHENTAFNFVKSSALQPIEKPLSVEVDSPLRLCVLHGRLTQHRARCQCGSCQCGFQRVALQLHFRVPALRLLHERSSERKQISPGVNLVKHPAFSTAQLLGNGHEVKPQKSTNKNLFDAARAQRDAGDLLLHLIII